MVRSREARNFLFEESPARSYADDSRADEFFAERRAQRRVYRVLRGPKGPCYREQMVEAISIEKLGDVVQLEQVVGAVEVEQVVDAVEVEQVSDAVEVEQVSDAVESDALESDAVESDAVESDAVDSDAVEIDRNLRKIAARRAGLDAELSRWLRRADEQRIWNVLGYVHALEYLEEVFGFSPRAARERLRVASELARLPAFESALAVGELSYGIVRELTRVATPDTEHRWLRAARGKNLRQVERLVSGHAKGDTPDDDVNPDLFECAVQWKLPAPIAALLRETRVHLNNEVGGNLDDAQLVEMLCRRALEPTAAACVGPSRMIHITTCERCQSSTQVGGGRRVPISMTELQLASCDATFVDDANGKRPTQSIPAAIRRQVMERDEHRCRVPGCRSSRNLDVHHLIPQCEGGGHELWNLIVLCSGHHRLHHEGILTIRGRADGDLTFQRRGRALTEDKAGHVLARHGAVESPAKSETARPTLQQVERNTLATRALQHSGFKHATAAEAVRRAASQVAADADLPLLLREALRFCR